MDEDVVRYAPRTMRLSVLGALLALFTLPFLLGVAVRLPYPGGFHFGDGVVLSGLVMFAGLAVLCLGIVVRKPVALRLDSHGMSGFYAPTLTWTDIRKVYPGACGGSRVIYLDLWQPEAYWAAQSAWKRLESAVSFQARMVAIRTEMVQAAGSDVLAAIEDRHTRFGRGAGP